jgi:hypothetical protein
MMGAHHSVEQELRRLVKASGSIDARPEGLGVVPFVATSRDDMGDVIRKSIEVLSTVDEHSLQDRWPSVEEWRRILPGWFVDRCAPELSQRDTDAWVARWRALSPEQQRDEEARQPWSLADWLYWLEPDRREWFWWKATLRDRNRADIELAVDSWPFPWGAFAWLLRASGADDVRAEMA